MSCNHCADEHLAPDDDCPLAEVADDLDDAGLADAAPNSDDWDVAGVPFPDETADDDEEDTP
jgi:hypothetical protein